MQQVTAPTAPSQTHLARPSKRGLAARFVRWITTANTRRGMPLRVRFSEVLGRGRAWCTSACVRATWLTVFMSLAPAPSTATSVTEAWRAWAPCADARRGWAPATQALRLGAGPGVASALLDREPHTALKTGRPRRRMVPSRHSVGQRSVALHNANAAQVNV